MKTKIVIHTVGMILLIEAGLLIIPAIVGLIYHEQVSSRAFLISACAAAAAGGALSLVKPFRLPSFCYQQTDTGIRGCVLRDSLGVHYHRLKYSH